MNRCIQSNLRAAYSGITLAVKRDVQQAFLRDTKTGDLVENVEAYNAIVEAQRAGLEVVPCEHADPKTGRCQGYESI